MLSESYFYIIMYSYSSQSFQGNIYKWLRWVHMHWRCKKKKNISFYTLYDFIRWHFHPIVKHNTYKAKNNLSFTVLTHLCKELFFFISHHDIHYIYFDPLEENTARILNYIIIHVEFNEYEQDLYYNGYVFLINTPCWACRLAMSHLFLAVLYWPYSKPKTPSWWESKG